MISCDSFRKKLNDYMEGKLSMDMNESIEEHMKGCRECRGLYEEERNIDEIFTEALSSRNLPYNSIRNEVLKSIDKRRYNGSIGSRVYFSVRKNYKRYISGIAAMILVFIAGIYVLGFNRGGSNPPIKQTEFKLPSPDTIIISNRGEQRVLYKGENDYTRILELMDNRFEGTLTEYDTPARTIGGSVFQKIESGEVYIEFHYNAGQSINNIYKAGNESVANSTFMRFIMPITGDKNDLLILGNGYTVYYDMFDLIGLKPPSDELINLATAKFPVKEREYAHFKTPEEIWFYRNGEKRIVRSDNPLFGQILRYADGRFGNKLGPIEKVYSSEDIENIKSSQLGLEFIYSNSQVLEFKMSDGRDGSAEYDKLLMPLGKDRNIVILGKGGVYLDGPLTGLSPSRELENILATAAQFKVENLSLSPELQSIYKQYAQKKDDNLLRGLDPVDICKLYYRAWEKLDYETVYALYVKFENGENFSYPDYKSFAADAKSNEMNKIYAQNTTNNRELLNEQIIGIEQIPTDSDSAEVQFTCRDKEKTGGGRISFYLQKDKNGIWKVSWMPY